MAALGPNMLAQKPVPVAIGRNLSSGRGLTMTGP